MGSYVVYLAIGCYLGANMFIIIPRNNRNNNKIVFNIYKKYYLKQLLDENYYPEYQD